MRRPSDEKPTILLLGYGERHAALAGRLLLLQFRPERADALAAALARLRGEDTPADAPPVRAVLLPVPLPLDDPPGDVAALREADPKAEPALVVVGARPDAAGLDRLRKAGVRFACFDPWTDSEIRFILNRAIHEPGRAQTAVRDGLRVPTNLMGRVFGGAGEKPVLVYNVSVGGAYLETHRPSPVGATVKLELPLDRDPLRLTASVVSTNVPGNLRRPNLPLGMGVRFAAPEPSTMATLERYVATRAKEFEL